MTLESIREDIQGFLKRLGEVEKLTEDYFASNFNKLLDQSLDVHELIGTFTKYIDDSDKIHREIDEYIEIVSKELPSMPADESRLHIMYLMIELKHMNDKAIKNSTDAKIKIVPVLMYLKSIGIE